jgi:hypothetical protein
MWLLRKKQSEGTIKPSWKPPTDPVFQYLWQEAMFGQLPVFFAAIPLPRVVPFDPTFRPECTADGQKVILSLMHDWKNGNFHNVWVYPRGDLFVAADDYFTLAAAKRGQPDFLPCLVLGTPALESVKDLQGPVDQDQLRAMFELNS